MGKKGFTLIEMLVGLVLLAIGLLAIAGMQIRSVNGNSFSANLTPSAAAKPSESKYSVLDPTKPARSRTAKS